MDNRRKVIFAATLVVLGLAGCVWVLTGQGLDHAEKWVSLVGVFLSVGLGTAGTIMSWAVWRHGRGRALPATTAAGESSVAVADLNSGKISTQSSAPADGRRAGAGAPPGGVTASGSAAVAIGGANSGDITTRSDATPRQDRDAVLRRDEDD